MEAPSDTFHASQDEIIADHRSPRIHRGQRDGQEHEDPRPAEHMPQHLTERAETDLGGHSSPKLWAKHQQDHREQQKEG